MTRTRMAFNLAATLILFGAAAAFAPASMKVCAREDLHYETSELDAALICIGLLIRYRSELNISTLLCTAAGEHPSLTQSRRHWWLLPSPP